MFLEFIISWKLILALLIPFIGTALGSSMVFLLKKELNEKLLKLLLGFASGVMIAASIWSLLDPAIDSFDKDDVFKWLAPSIGFLVGILFLFLMDIIIPHMHLNNSEEGPHKKISKTTKMLFAVTLHNIPEGLAVGVVLAGAITGNINEGAALTLAIGIAIQNFPEGAIISMPLKETGVSKLKAFILGVLSGLVEPIASIIAILLTSFIKAILPYTLSFAAGAMIYVVSEELIPEYNEGNHSNLGTIGLAIGFVIMMSLDIALG